MSEVNSYVEYLCSLYDNYDPYIKNLVDLKFKPDNIRRFKVILRFDPDFTYQIYKNGEMICDISIDNIQEYKKITG